LFDDGVSRFVPENTYNKYGVAQSDGTTFVLPKNEADAMMSKGADYLENALGLPTGYLDGNNLLRLDVSNPRDFNLRVPSGNEAGANDLWLPAGKLPTGGNEAIIDGGKMSPSDYNIGPVKVGVGSEIY